MRISLAVALSIRVAGDCLGALSEEKWCCQTGLNCRPLHYQWSALPLSYGSKPKHGNRPFRGTVRRPILATRLQGAQVEAASWGGITADRLRRLGIRFSTRTNRAGEACCGSRAACLLRINSPAPTDKGRIRTFEQKRMTEKRETDREAENGGRRTRLRAALRENLKRRKSQSRGRADQAASATDPDPEHRDE